MFLTLKARNGKFEVCRLVGYISAPVVWLVQDEGLKNRGFLKKMNEIAGYIVSDIQEFPAVPCWIIPVETVSEWWQKGELGTTTKITRDKALKLIRRM